GACGSRRYARGSAGGVGYAARTRRSSADAEQVTGDRDRDGQTDAFGVDRFGGGDADHLLLRVDDWATGVAGVDRCVELQALPVLRRTEGADDADSNAVLQTEGRADDEHRLADGRRRRGRREAREVFVGVQQREILALVDLHDLGLEALVPPLDRHVAAAGLVVVLDHVEVGDHVGATAGRRLAERERGAQRLRRAHAEHAGQDPGGDGRGVEAGAGLLLQLLGPV